MDSPLFQPGLQGRDPITPHFLLALECCGQRNALVIQVSFSPIMSVQSRSLRFPEKSLFNLSRRDPLLRLVFFYDGGGLNERGRKRRLSRAR